MTTSVSSIPITAMPHLSDANPALGRATVLTKAALRAAERLGVTDRQLAQIIGVSEATISRLWRNEAVLEDGTKPFQMAVVFVRIFRSLDAITGGDEGVARAWLTKPAIGLSNCKPIDLLQTTAGAEAVEEYLTRLEYGVYV